MTTHQFTQPITTEAELRAFLGEPSELVIRKQLTALDAHCRAFVASSPFMLLGSTAANGSCDVSPRGDAAGFVLVHDAQTLIVPERPGNRRADSLRNILQTGQVGMLFLIPGVEEFLRINGRAQLVRDPDLLQGLTAHGKQPLLAIVVQVEECFLHCAKAIKRSRLWNAESWPTGRPVASLAQMLMDQIQPANATLADLEQGISESYAQRLY